MNYNTERKINKKLLYLIILFFVIIIVIALLNYQKFNSNLSWKENIFNIFQKNDSSNVKPIENTVTPLETQIDAKESVVVENLNSKKEKEENKSEIFYANKISELEKKLLEQQSVIEKLSQNNRSKFMFISLSYKVINSLETNKPFNDQINIFLSFVTEEALKNKIKSIYEYKEQGVPTSVDLQKEFMENIYKKIYLDDLKYKNTLKAKIKYFVYDKVFIINSNDPKRNHIAYKLNKINNLLKNNNLEEAIDGIANISEEDPMLLDFANKIRSRIKVNRVIDALEENIGNYSK